MRKYSFRKQERLCSKSSIDKLFSQGNSFLCYPIKIVWFEVDKDLFSFPAQVAFTVPKRMFKRAPHRNILKRRMRESYRLQKHGIYETLETEDKKIAFMAIYVAKEILPYDRINTGMTKAMSRLQKAIAPDIKEDEKE